MGEGLERTERETRPIKKEDFGHDLGHDTSSLLFCSLQGFKGILLCRGVSQEGETTEVRREETFGGDTPNFYLFSWEYFPSTLFCVVGLGRSPV